ncbi:MAG: nickel-dependent lactate racemase [Kiritimatiellae bacterium]|nr:nickel-dependent lactate racemase [Kiritimatiellia bacterium]
MRIELSETEFPPFDLPDERLVGIAAPSTSDVPGLSDDDLRSRIRSPIGSLSLRELAAGASSVLVVTDDLTRKTPLHRVVPLVLEELHAAGLRDEAITILIGLGTHRDMTPAEIEAKYGTAVASRYRIVNHRWDNPDELREVEQHELPFPVVVNRRVLESDLVIAVGSIVPHATCGFSSGGKSIVPGVAGGATIENTHWMALDYPMRDIIGVFDTPMRRAVCTVARQAGLDFIVNTVIRDEGQVVELVAGDPEKAHRVGVDHCRKVYGVEVPEAADIVIAEAYPCGIDLRQAIKAICAADIVCKDGGVIILPAACPEGVSPQFPEFEILGFKDPEGLYRRVEDGAYDNKLLAYTLVAIGRIISQRVRAILVSPGINRETTERLGFLYAESIESALQLATTLTSTQAEITVLRQASILWPILRQVSS